MYTIVRMLSYARKVSLVCVLAAAMVNLPSYSQENDSRSFKMPISDTFTITGRGVFLTGRIDSGSIAIGDKVCIPLTSGETIALPVKGIERFREVLDRADAGQDVGILVDMENARMVMTGALLHTDC